GPMLMDNAARRLRFEDRTIDLPNREYSLLEILVGRLGQVVSKAEITNRLFALSEEAGSNTVELYVARLRKKLPQQFLRIVTVRGTGYLAETLRDCAQAQPGGGAHE
ncbi:winged helix-turn-helix transcriptional regulator, partial [Streptomyces sp. S9]|nr:winged helix-turn-helix transcriptional regulator [Streptomyces sp. S9]